MTHHSWCRSCAGTEEMAKTVGMWPARPGESWSDLRYRIKQKLMCGQSAGDRNRPWYETAAGIKTKGNELGLTIEAGESLPHFLSRVAEHVK